MMKFFTAFLIVLGTSFCSLIYIGNVATPNLDSPRLSEQQIKETSAFFNKSEAGVHNVFLSGTAFERGQQFGYWTQDFLGLQEKALVDKLDEVIPFKAAQYALFLASMGWFHGLDDFYQKNWIEEMYGVSFYGSKENLYFATPFTRQLAYHGIHDMGQMMIDHGMVLGACTQLAVPRSDGWLIGRNFDFEAGRVFDEDKLLKWVYPAEGEAFVSVLFSGMVGVITGINQHGVYVAINAAGSDDFTRLGTPTSLIVTKALQESKNAKQAVEVLKKSKPLITDIFVVADRGDTLYIVEKTPERVDVIEQKKKTVVTNHLQSESFTNDKTNQKRMKTNTTLARFHRGEALLSERVDWSPKEMANALRDKIQVNGRPAFLHRNSIDAMIASHSVIFDSKKMQLYVSKGPSLSEAYIGYDLEKSFAGKKPVLIGKIESDPELEGYDFYELKGQLKSIQIARKEAEAGQCEEASSLLSLVNKEPFKNHYALKWAEASLSYCKGQMGLAITQYLDTLKLEPAYPREKELINEKLSKIQ